MSSATIRPSNQSIEPHRLFLYSGCSTVRWAHNIHQSRNIITNNRPSMTRALCASNACTKNKGCGSRSVINWPHGPGSGSINSELWIRSGSGTFLFIKDISFNDFKFYIFDNNAEPRPTLKPMRIHTLSQTLFKWYLPVPT
jgi:hypothetical protein